MKKIKEEHQERIRKTLKKLLKIRLRSKFSKNEFKKEEVKFLEYIVEQENIKLNSKKIRVLRK